MDTLDVRILRLLLQGYASCHLTSDFRESYAAIAENIGADPETVRYRVKKLHETGFMQGWHLFVNPRLWGGGQVMAQFDVDPTSPKDDVIEKLKLVPGMTLVQSFYDSIAAFLAYYDEMSLPRQIELIRRLSGAADLFVAKLPLPESGTPLTAKDWDLVRALRRDPRKPYSVLAKEVGLSSRTVKGKVSRMAREGVAFAWPEVNMRAMRGGVLVHLRVFYPGECKNEIDRTILTHLDDYVWCVVHMLPYHSRDLWPCGYNLVVPNVSAMREFLSWTKDVPGVQSATTRLLEDYFTYFARYDEELETRLRLVPTAMPTEIMNTPRKSFLVAKHT